MPAPLPLGNDVVDLGSACNRSSATNPHYVNRVLADPELELLDIADDRHLAFWALWAAKEAAYKALTKDQPELAFIHRHFVVESETPLTSSEHRTTATGQVCHGRQKIPVLWEWTPDWIHCITTSSAEPARYSVGTIRKLGSNASFVKMQQSGNLSDESIAARLLALSLLAQSGWNDVQVDRPAIGQHRGPPRIMQSGNVLANLQISLSHDGRFAAAAVACPAVNLGSSQPPDQIIKTLGV
ncbi:MAG: 4-phosphopantetheinyl transferase family protein [Gammaproteobacteria bacterium]|nr:4-phosphopantetheinyl transferase family protein [Gammaproteobacteria bacterium]